MGLAVQDERVDRAPDIVDRGVADEIDRAGIGIDFDLADLRAVGEARERDGLVRHRAQRPLQIRRQIRPRRRRLRHRENAERAVGAGDARKLRATELDVLECRPRA